MIIIFDICGTLYNSNTTMDFCEWRCKDFIQKIILKLSKTLAGKIINKMFIKIFYFDIIRILHIRSLKNMKYEILVNDAKRFVDEFLEFKKIEYVHSKLNDFKKTDIILLSATIDPIAEAISKKLGDIKFISTTLEYDTDGNCQGRIKTDLLANKEKYFQNVNIDFVITDNKSDLNLCRLSKNVEIVSKNKNILFWKKQINLNITKIIEV